MGNIKVKTRWITGVGLVLLGLVLACVSTVGPGSSSEESNPATPTQLAPTATMRSEEEPEAEASPLPPTPTEAVIYTADENPCITVWHFKGGAGGLGQDKFDIPAGKAVLEKLPGGNYAAYSPDGQTIVTMDDSTIYLWRADSYDLLHKITNDSFVPPSFSPDSSLLATWTGTQTLRLLIVESGDPAEDFEISVDPDDTRQHWVSNGPIQFSPNGDRIAVGIGRSIAIVDATSGEVIRILAGELLSNPEDILNVEAKNGPASSVSQLEFDNSGMFLFSNENAGWVHLWDVETGQYLRCIPHGLDSFLSVVSKMALSPDGRTIAVAMSNKIKFYDATNGEPLNTWRIPDNRDCKSFFKRYFSGASNPITYSRDGRSFMVGLEDGTVHIYDTLTDKLTGLLWHPGSVSSVDENGNSDRIITGVGGGLNEAWIWDANHADVSREVHVQNWLEDGVSKALGGDIEGAKEVFKQAQASNPYPEHDLIHEGLERVTVAFIDQAIESAVAGDSRRALELIDLALEVNPCPELDLRFLAIDQLVREICNQAGRDLTPEEYELYRPNNPSTDTCQND